MSDTPDRGTDPVPRTSRRPPRRSVATIVSATVIALLFLAVVIGLILRIVD